MTSEQTKELKDAASKFLVALPLPNGQQSIRPAKILNLYNENIAEMEHELFSYTFQKMQQIDGIKFYGIAPQKVAVISFNIGTHHPYDVGFLLDQMGIAVRTGHHCTQPIMQRFGIPGTVRASFALYNTKEEIDLFLDALHKVITMLD